MFSKGAAREQRGVGARADWLVRYLRSRTADGGHSSSSSFSSDGRTPPSNCDCSPRCSVRVGLK